MGHSPEPVPGIAHRIGVPERARAVNSIPRLNTPAGFRTGYVAGVELATLDEPMGFSGRDEVDLDRQWPTVGSRTVHPLTGRILIARRRDAAVVPGLGRVSRWT